MLKKCLQCGKEFNASQAELNKGMAKYCGRECFGKGIRKKIEAECLQCGKVFYTYPNRPRNHCSLKCGYLSIRTKKNVKCIVCGKDFLARPDNIKKGGGKFCSRKCFGTWESINRIGENSATWKGGITPIRELIRNSRNYRYWRNSVVSRDKACLKCGSVSDLRAHHKHKFHKHIEAIILKMPLLSIYEAAMLYKPLWDISNGITLCESCHRKEHKWKSRTYLASLPDLKGEGK